MRHPRGRRQSSATTPTASQSTGVGYRGVMRLRISGTTFAPSRRRKLGVPGSYLRDDLAIPLLRRAGPSRPATDRRACTSRCSRTRTRRSRTARRRRRTVACGFGSTTPVRLERRRRSLGRGLLAGRDVLAQRLLAQELPERVGDASEIDAGVLADRLERRVEEDVVVLAAAEDRVGERDQAHRLVVRAVPQIRVERDVEPRVRVLRQHLPLDQLGEPLARPRRCRARSSCSR